MTTLMFVVPAQGRFALAEVCYRQLRRTCDSLTDGGIHASAVIVADDENLELAREQGFATVERDNTQLGRKLNDGYQLAGMAGADFMVPLGNDDWVDPDWIRLPNDDEVIVTHYSSLVNEDATRLARLAIQFGDGVRVFPRRVMAQVGFRPVDEDRNRAMDASTKAGLRKAGLRPHRFVWHEADPLQIVDWKSAANLNPYRDCLRYQHGRESHDPFGDLAEFYPAESIAEMRSLHRQAVAA